MTERFKEWMIDQGLSESSVSKYNGAVKGVLSDWAGAAGIIQVNLLEISSPSDLFNVILQIEKLLVFQERNSAGNGMYSSALNQYTQYRSHHASLQVEDDIEEILSNKEITETDKTRLIKTRIGQGKYRQDLIDLWRACCVTGYPDTSLLVASHIKPWASSTNKERLDKYNGLLLLPNLDKAFDFGLISFRTTTGEIMISGHLRCPELIGVSEKMSIHLNEGHMDYMKYHNVEVFRS